LYKIALTMHVEHAHSELQTRDNNVMKLPIVSETTSLAKANEDNCSGQVVCEENAGTSRIQKNDELGIKIDYNTSEGHEQELDISNNDNYTDDDVNHNAQSVNQVNGNKIEVVEKIANEDAMEVDSTNEIKNNEETTDFEKKN